MYNQFLLPSGSYEHDRILQTDNIHLILRYVAAMYSGSEYELRYLSPIRTVNKFTVGQISPSSSWSGSVEHNLSASIGVRIVGPSGSTVIQNQLSVGDLNLDPTASIRLNGLIRIMGGAPFSGAILSSISDDGLAQWIDPRILPISGTGGSGGSGSTLPGTPTGSIQFNNNNTFGGSSFLLYNSSSHHVNVSGAISSSYGFNTVGFYGTSSWAVSSSKANTASLALTASYVTTLRASAPTYSVQFNDNDILTGSSNLWYNRFILGLTGSLHVYGSESIRMSGSSPGLTIRTNYYSGSILQLPYIIPPTDRFIQTIYAPSASINSYGQVWITAYGPSPTHIYDIVSQSGELRYRGRIGDSSTTGRHGGTGLYLSNLDRIALTNGEFSGPDLGKLYFYNPTYVGIQPLNFTASINSAYELSLIDYSCSIRENVTGSGISDIIFFLSNQPMVEFFNTSLSSYFLGICGYATSSNGSANNVLWPSTPLSAAINSNSASNQPLYTNINAVYPLGFFCSTADNNQPSTEYYVDITSDLYSNGVPDHKLFSGSFNGNVLTSAQSRTRIIESNDVTNRLYVTVTLINNNNNDCIVEYDTSVDPPSFVSLNTGSLETIYALKYNPNTAQVCVRAGTTFYMFGVESTMDWTTPVQTWVIPQTSVTNIVSVDSDFYAYGYNANSGTSSSLFVYKFEWDSLNGIYNLLSSSFATSYFYGNAAYAGVSNGAFAAGNNRLYCFDRSNIGPANQLNTYPENGVTLFARSNYLYSINTSSLTALPITPYSTGSLINGVNLVEFFSETTLMSYINSGGMFIGTSSIALTSSYTPFAFVHASLTGSSLDLFRGNGTNISLILPTSSGGTGSITSPGGANRQIQYNNSGIFGGASSLFFGGNLNQLLFSGAFGITGSVEANDFFGNNASITNIGATNISAVGFTGSLLGTASYATNATTAKVALTASYLNGFYVKYSGGGFTPDHIPIGSTSDTLQDGPLYVVNSAFRIDVPTGMFTLNDPINILTIDANSLIGDTRYGLDLTGSLYVLGALQTTGSVSVEGLINNNGQTVITGSYNLSGSAIITGSQFTTGSVYLSGMQISTGSFLLSGSFISTGSLIQTGSFFLNGLLIQTGSLNFTGSAILSGNLYYDLAVTDIPFQGIVFDDFLTAYVAASSANILTATSGGASATVNYISPSVDCTTGQIRCSTGTTTWGRAQIYTQNTTMTFGGATPWIWAARVKVSQSSDATDNFTCSIGTGDSITGPQGQVDWMGFYYNHNANGGQWSFRSQRAGVMSSSSITYPFTASQYHVFKFQVNGAGTSASAYIDDYFMGFVTTNIPTGSATFGTFNIGLQKNGGTNARVLDIDFVYAKLTPPSRSNSLLGWRTT